jgi:pyridoxamine 5'-phosphate oxidase
MRGEEPKLEKTIRTHRKDFEKGALSEAEVHPDPFQQFSQWLETEFSGGNAYANAMVLSTTGKDGMPSSRVMLLRDISHGGLTFFTNYRSSKAEELEENPKAALLFFWPGSERQVRVQGKISRLPVTESDDYFGSRPFESRVGAWASQQSAVISSRQELDERYQQALEKYKDGRVPRPPHWGGYVLHPTLFEFWQGRTGRLHDRLRYRPFAGGKWQIERLMP